MKTVLTDISVRALKAPARGQITIWDKNSPVGIRVTHKGTKTFIVMVGSGRRRTVGRVGIITLADARTARLKAMKRPAKTEKGLAFSPTTSW